LPVCKRHRVCRRQVYMPDACLRMLTPADVGWRMLKVGMQRVCRRQVYMPDACWRMLTYADMCWRGLTYVESRYADALTESAGNCRSDDAAGLVLKY
jgi:hypothetical protein